jgi:hypothetical protein
MLKPSSPSTVVSVLSVALVLCPAASAFADNAQTGLTATTWDQALELSQRYDKPILIDFFTEW